MKTKCFLLAVAVATIAVTFSCSSDEGEKEGGGGTCSANFKTVKIGTQTWMAENSNCDVEGRKCYDNNSANCTKYGGLYDWSMAITVCPAGWHLPSVEEWEILTAYIGGENEGEKLRAKSGWNGNGNGTDNYSFRALPGGYGTSYDNSDAITFKHIGDEGLWWSSSESSSDRAYGWGISEHASTFNDPKYRLFSVRCLKD